jgi:tRNA modification GTPase
LAHEIAALLADAERAGRLRDGLTIAVVGSPNAGKSSLVNALSGRDVAIVTPVPGTTRDLLEAPITVAGVAATLIDTAGLRATADPVEAEGVRRARARAASADLVLHVADTIPAERLGQLVINKIDLGVPVPPGAIGVSALTGAGLPALRRWLEDWAAALLRPGEPALLAHARHRAAFAAAHGALIVEPAEPVLAAEQLRLAARALGRITGRAGVEDVLDVIFSRFCIGK